jgi:hypothetical protein
MVVPPQVQKLMNHTNSNVSQSNNSNAINATLTQLGIDPNKLQAPQLENLMYNNQTGVAHLTLNFTNPMTNTSLDVSSFSVDVADSNGTQLFTIQLDKGVNIGAGQTGDIALSGTALNDNAKVIMNSLINGNGTQTIDMNDLQLSNLNANIGGITIHVDNINSQKVLGGFFGGG